MISYLITGTTGLIGSAIVGELLSHDDDIQIVAPVRNLAKAHSMFPDEKSNKRLYFVECDLLTTDFSFAKDIDYIIHCAAPTSSQFFVEHPIETFDSIYLPSVTLLQYASRNKVKGFVYLSSLEVYGTITDDQLVTEELQGYLDPLSVRSSYPMAKRAVEHLCHLYAKQYGVPVSIARLTQTTGPGAVHDDPRVIADFCRCARIGEDIILRTMGESARPYCHIYDAVSAILHILRHGSSGEAYNVANPVTFISARDLAYFIRQNFNPDIQVRFEISPNTPFAPYSKLRLSTAKLERLGWHPQYSLYDICASIISEDSIFSS